MGVELTNCTPETLSGYLKALGVFRLFSEQVRQVRATWTVQKTFAIDANVSEILEFFLYEYKPTPVISPWNGSTGFYPKDNKATLEVFERSRTPRLEEYRKAIAVGKKIVSEMGLKRQPTGTDDAKKRLVVDLRNRIPDAALPWMDACIQVSERDSVTNLEYPAILGSGGNDGNFEFSRTFQQQLLELFNVDTGEPTESSQMFLVASLSDVAVPGLPFSGKIGQFDPVSAGGVNAAPGFEGKSRVNPWDFVLTIEGAIALRASIDSRLDPEFLTPFAASLSSVGYASAAENEKSRGEVWLPLWYRPCRFPELQHRLSQGRIRLGSNPQTGAEMAVDALISPSDRAGIDGFVRFGFLERNGRAYFAVPLGVIE